MSHHTLALFTPSTSGPDDVCGNYRATSLDYKGNDSFGRDGRFRAGPEVGEGPVAMSTCAKRTVVNQSVERNKALCLA